MRLFSRIEVSIILAGLLSVGIVGYSLSLMSNTVKQLLPLIQISNDLKVKVGSAHLWFEEAMEGDKTIHLETQVYGNIDQALILVQSQLSQTKQIDAKLYATTVSGLRTLASALRVWREQTSSRWRDLAGSRPGSYKDQLYDATFHDILRLCDANIKTIDELVIQRQETLRRINLSFVLFLISIFSVVVITSLRHRQSVEAKNLELAKLSLVASKTDNAVTILDPRGRIEWVNDSFSRMSGYSLEDLRGTTPGIIPGEKSSAQEFLNYRKDGTPFWVSVSVTPIRNEENEITHFISIASDITERKHSEEALMKLSQAVEQTDDLVTITNREGIIEYVNTSFEKLTGFNRGEAIGQKPSILKSGKHQNEFYENLWKTIVDGRVFRAEIMNKKKNGEIFHEEKTISPIRDNDGNITHYVSTAKDVTERKLMERELNHSRQMKMLGQIASGVAHEVRNPLNAILAVSEAMFQEFSGDAERREYLDHIRNQVQRLSALMGDLLDLGKPIPNSMMRKTSLVDLCVSSINLWKQYHPDSSHFVRLIQATAADVNVHRVKFQQVLVNLLDNAVEHSPPDSEIAVMILGPDNGHIRLCVQDHGSGIVDENLDRIFEPFFTTRKSGTGLGLSLVKHIIETHGGKISMRNSDPAPGCCVEIILPVWKTGENEAANTSD